MAYMFGSSNSISFGFASKVAIIPKGRRYASLSTETRSALLRQSVSGDFFTFRIHGLDSLHNASHFLCARPAGFSW
jgi:hypothetical protein